MGKLSSLEHWKGDGRNHIVLDGLVDDRIESRNFGRALITSKEFQRFRPVFDLVNVDVRNLWATSATDRNLPMLVSIVTKKSVHKLLLSYFSISYTAVVSF